MPAWQIRSFDARDGSTWDDLVDHSPSGALQHRKRFLGYHGTRFQDASIVISRGGVMEAVFPAAMSPVAVDQVISHPGAAYGGLVTRGSVRPSEIPGLTESVLKFYAERGNRSIVVRAPWPWTLQRPNETFNHELLRLGARAEPWQLISVIDLRDGLLLSSRRRRMVRRAERIVEVHSSLSDLGSFWDVLENRLHVTHETSPTHSRLEIENLVHRLPGNLRLATAWEDETLVAGVLSLHESAYVHLQYMAASDRGREVGATDFLIVEALDGACKNGARFLSLGSSLDPSGHAINGGLLDFKHEFGAGTLLIPALSIDL